MPIITAQTSVNAPRALDITQGAYSIPPHILPMTVPPVSPMGTTSATMKLGPSSTSFTKLQDHQQFMATHCLSFTNHARKPTTIPPAKTKIPKPNIPFLKWDGKPSLFPKFNAFLKTYQQGPYFSCHWTINLSRFDAHSTHI